jgi:dCMP deaminase
MKIAFDAGERSTCLRRMTGAVLVTREHRIIALGYNGAPAGLPHCEELGGCLREQLKIPSGERHEICRAVHAEQNVLMVCAMYGASTKNTTLYATTFPCIICAKLLIQAGIEQVVYLDPYGDEKSNAESMKMFNQAGIHLRKLEDDGSLKLS